ncbi:proteoglycan 3-like [Petaurus breviceps papuanus]|uniref:proteoglycan 3-like n=1 Tax=Petaurus breviceps papuanus TaxID=3040969 RepID=UPI0036DD9B1A
MKLCLILSLVLLRTVSSFHLKNKDLKIDTLEKEETLNEEQEISGEEESVASGEGDSWWEKKEASGLGPVPATKEDDNDVCPKEEDIVHLTGTPECQGCRFLLIRQQKTFGNAQATCRRCYGGRLVSTHSYNPNCLIYRASQGLEQGQVWIGGHVSGWSPFKRFLWLDGSRWNFAYWASGQLGNGRGNCVTLYTRGGHWQRAPCDRKLPFICSY